MLELVAQLPLMLQYGLGQLPNEPEPGTRSRIDGHSRGSQAGWVKASFASVSLMALKLSSSRASALFAYCTTPVRR
jgi:hypothetical protein